VIPLDEAVVATLRECYDPEIPVNIVDLGLVRAVRVDGADVAVTMTLTSRFCPLAAHISDGIEDKLREIDGVGSARVHLVWEPPWTPSEMSPAARTELGLA
jgi:metal-sulfur cluster biosynthetic enzyme